MKRTMLLCAALVVLAAGCFPLLLDVDGKGNVLIPRTEGLFSYNVISGKATLVARPDEGTPAWARWSPDGSRVLLAEAIGDNNKTALYVVGADGADRKELGQFGAMGIALWSPDGKRVTFGELGMGGGGIKAVDVAGGQVSTVQQGSFIVHQWIDANRLLVFEPANPDDDPSPGRLVVKTLEPAGTKGIVETTMSKTSMLDVSPDGRTVAVIEAVESDEAGPAPTQLVLVNMDAATKTAVAVPEAQGAFFSPDGKHLAIAAGDSRIVITDAEGKNPQTLTDEAVNKTAKDMMNQTAVYPCWADNETVLYFRNVNTYANVGTAIHLVKASIDGSRTTDLQLEIDNAVAKLAAEE